MKTQLTCVPWLGLRIGIVVVATACATASHSAPIYQEGVRTLLVQEIQRKLANSAFPVEWDNSRLEVFMFASGVVPGLRYHQGTYRVPNVSHGFALAFAGSNRRHSRILKSPSDWAELAAGWHPARPAAALQACSELIRVAGADPDPRFPPLVIVDSLSLQSSRIPPGALAVSLDIFPRLQMQGRRAHAVVWALEPGIRRKYLCSLAWESGHLEAQLTVADSVGGEGLLPRSP